MTDTVGYCAAILTTLSFLPQAIKTIKTKDTSGISLLMYSMFTIGVFGWLVYGFLKRDIPVFVANLVTLSLAGIILTMKIKYK
ncbi:SemiSWEET transporter [Candidatus Cetobacterium colombiensis]|jgi:MtN3 and saliva related transmembrane protein|uniref:SemiSWEET transporter n=1 Tax=Candidatus Cetobacterium colombiensis TaxID=3073100 RepID=A0ABU4W995_9FUSO|nr:SemiSWEET transporter [Candidatus Cetobacterium colombiensis]MDX8336092.1 SemiSWEET transporter [Candidatus Cetobacterium colombiensis]